MSGVGRLLRCVALGLVAGVVAANVIGLVCTFEGPPRTVSYWVDEMAAALGLTITALVLAAGLVHGGLVALRPASGVAAPDRLRAPPGSSARFRVRLPGWRRTSRKVRLKSIEPDPCKYPQLDGYRTLVGASMQAVADPSARALRTDAE